MSIEVQELKDAIEAKGQAVNELKHATEKYHEEAKANGTALAETKAELAKINEKYAESDTAKIDAEKRIADLEIAFKRKGGNADLEITEGLAEHKSAFANYLRSGERKSAEMSGAEETALAKIDSLKAIARNFQPGQGYLVPVDSSGRMVTAIHDSSNMRSLASVQAINTDALQGQRDLGLADAEWTGETSPPPSKDLPDVGTYNIPVHEIAAKVRASTQLIEDSSINIESWISGKGAQIFGLKEENAFFLGNGVAKPRGIATYVPDYATNIDVIDDGTIRTVKSGVSAQITDPAVIIKMVERLKSGYQTSAQFGMSRQMREQVRLLKQDDKFTWQPGLQAGVPDRLIGYDVNEQNDLAVGAGTIGILFGDFAQTYQIVDRVGFSLLIDPFSAKPLVEYYMRRRVGGQVINFDSMVYCELSA